MSGNPKGRPKGSRNKRMKLTPERVVMFFNQAETEDQIRVLGEETWRQALSGKNQRLFNWVTNLLLDAEAEEEAAGG